MTTGADVIDLDKVRGPAAADPHYIGPHDGIAEQYVVSAFVANPALLNDEVVDAFAAADIFDFDAQEVFGVVRNLQAAGKAIDRAAVVAVIERNFVDKAGHTTGHKTHPTIDALLNLAELEPPTVAGVHRMIELITRDARERDRIRDAVWAAAEEQDRLEAELDDVAMRDVDLSTPTLPRDSVPVGGKHPAPPPPPPRARWIVPLESFLGEEEPDENDAADWIIRDIIPRGEAGLIAGPPKCGKTWAMLGLGIDVALGRSWLDAFDNTMGGPARVLALAFEDGQRRLRKRVWELARARGITPNEPTLRAHLAISREPLSLPGDERAFAAELRAWKPTLVLIDNLTRVMVGDQNAIKDAKRFSDTWCKLCSDVGAAVEFLHHTSKVGPIRPDKRGEGDPFELIRGSGDLVASARHLVLMRPLESPDGEKLSDVRMRGNIDLRREDFVLGFQREEIASRWTARLSDRGAGEAMRDELADRRKAKGEERKAARAASSAGMGGSVDDRVLAAIVSMHDGGAGDLCTREQLKSTSGVQRGLVSPALDRLLHGGRVQIKETKRLEGGKWRSRAIFVPAGMGSA